MRKYSLNFNTKHEKYILNNTKGDVKKAENANWLIHRPISGQGVVFLSMESFIYYMILKRQK